MSNLPLLRELAEASSGWRPLRLDDFDVTVVPARRKHGAGEPNMPTHLTIKPKLELIDRQYRSIQSSPQGRVLARLQYYFSCYQGGRSESKEDYSYVFDRTRHIGYEDDVGVLTVLFHSADPLPMTTFTRFFDQFAQSLGPMPVNESVTQPQPSDFIIAAGPDVQCRHGTDIRTHKSVIIRPADGVDAQVIFTRIEKFFSNILSLLDGGDVLNLGNRADSHMRATYGDALWELLTLRVIDIALVPLDDGCELWLTCEADDPPTLAVVRSALPGLIKLGMSK